MKATIKILIADNHAIVRNGIRNILDCQDSFIAVVTEVENGAELIDHVSKNKFDLIIMNINLPKTDGISAIEILKRSSKIVPILVLGRVENAATINRAIKAGAVGFVLQSVGCEELVKAIMTVKTNTPYFSNEISQIILGLKKNEKNAIKKENKLSKREAEILKMLADDHNTEEIATVLGISKRTVEGHRNSIKSKLNIKSSVGLVKFAYQMGYFL